jgi:ribonuclease HII
LEQEGYERGFRRIAGLDEVGRGPWAGPVVAAAVVLPRGIIHSKIRDSKLLRPRRREELALWIKQKALAWAVGIIGPEEIDRINILKATLLAMAVAVKQLEPGPDLLLIDGAHTIPLAFLKAEGTPRAFPFQRAIKKGDRICHSIAAASIVAKVARDQIMVEYDRLYPDYGFGQHKGYGSLAHSDALKRLGPSPIHRLSFKPVRDCAPAGLSKEAVSNQPTLTLALSLRERVG